MSVREVDEVLALVRGPRPEGNPFSHPAYRALFARAEAATVDERDGLNGALLPGLAVPDPYQAACVALTCGTLVEYGASASVAGEPIMQRMAEAFTAGEGMDDVALRYFGVAAMAHLCRDKGLRRTARRMPALRAELASAEDRVQEAWFIGVVLDLIDDLELLVLAPDQGRGFRVRLEAVKNNFHLFTLLQGSLIGDPAEGWLSAEPIDPEVVAVATGEAPPREDLDDRQRFHFHDWSALSGEGELRRDLHSTLWGEGTPLDIPLHQGRPVVLLGAAIFGGRSWDSNIFASVHDALRSRAQVIAKLTHAEVAAELTSIAARSRDLKI